MRLLIITILIILFISCENNECIFDYQRHDIGFWNMNNDNQKVINFTLGHDEIIIKIFDDEDNEYSFIEGGIINSNEGRIEMILKENSIFKSELFSKSNINRGFIYLVYYK